MGGCDQPPRYAAFFHAAIHNFWLYPRDASVSVISSSRTRRNTASREGETEKDYYLPGDEIPEDYWVYRMLKKQVFFGMGAYG